MTPLAAKNIEQSFRRLASGEEGFCTDFRAIADADSTYEEPFDIHGITFRPVLYRTTAGSDFAQSHYLGFYATQRAIRGLLLGINYAVAGNALLSQQLCGPAVASYYTAAYHALHGFLSLAGRNFLDSTIWPIASHEPSGDLPDRFIAVLTRNNHWLLESRPRNHRSRWNEVRQVFATSTLPECFYALFDNMYRGCFRRGVDLVELVKQPAKYRIQLPEKIDDFLRRISEVRHEAMYASFGSDPHVVEALWNGDAYSESGIENQAVDFGCFAIGLLTEVAADLNALATRIEMTPNVRTALALSVRLPWFDTPRIDLLPDSELRARCQVVDEWLDRTVALK